MSPSSAEVSTSTCSPAFGRMVMCSCASGDSPNSTLLSTYSPRMASFSSDSMRRRTSVLKRSRGM